MPHEVEQTIRYRVAPIAIFALIALIAALGLRMASPSDLFHQTQPKTISYTTDMLLNGHWVLPYERGVEPATKPLLYNWIAAPFVAVFGYDSEFAHKMPSILSLIACWLLVAWLGVKHLREPWLGFLAASMLVANYTIFKLGYLARPDMVLTLCLFIGWIAATRILIDAANNRRARAGVVIIFWAACAGAYMAKGLGFIPLVYAILGAPLIAGRWSAVHAFRWWWGIPLSVLPFAMWIWGVYRAEPQFVIERLWQNEVAGRVVGTGTEGSRRGPLGIVYGLFHMPLYYLMRSMPWSLFSIIAMVALWLKVGPSRGWQRLEPDRGMWLHGAAVWTVLIIAIFTISAGKRADYIAAAYPTGALLAAWWWLRLADAYLRRGRVSASHLCRAVIAPAIVVVILIAMAVVEWREPQSPEPRYGDHMTREIRLLREYLPQDDQRPVYLRRPGIGHLWAFLARGREVEELSELLEAIERGETFWLIEGDGREESDRFDELPRVRRSGARITRIHQSAMLGRTHYWPGRVSLMLVEPPIVESDETHVVD